MTASTNMHWGETEWNSVSFDQTTTFENNRVQTAGWEFDNDGRNTKAISDTAVTTHTVFDAAGRIIQRSSTSGGVNRTYYDGNGKTITSTSTAESQKYQIRSSLMKGQVIAEVWPNGKKYRSYVKGLGNQTAVQTAYATATASLNESVLFEYSDVLGMSYRTTDKDAAAVAVGDGGEGSPIETDPLGGSVGTSTPYIEEPIFWEPDPEYPELVPFIIGDEHRPMMDFGSMYSFWGSRIADLPGFGTNWGSFIELELTLYSERVDNARLGLGFITHEERDVLADFLNRLYGAMPTDGNNEGGATAAHEAGHAGSGINGEESSDAGSSGDGSWVDTSTSSVNYNTNTVTINVSGYWDTFGFQDVMKLPKSLFDVDKVRYRDPASLERNFKAALAVNNGTGTCLDKLNAVLDRLGSKVDSIEKIAKKVFSNRYKLFETKLPVQFQRFQNAQGKWEPKPADGGATTSNGATIMIILNSSIENQTMNFIHELLHASSGNNRVYSESEVRAAIAEVEGSTSGLNNFIGKYCRPGGF